MVHVSTIRPVTLETGQECFAIDISSQLRPLFENCSHFT